MKYRIKDEDGSTLEIEEIQDEEIEEIQEPIEEPIEDNGLTPEEIDSLRQLIAAAPQLLALIETNEEVADEEIEEEIYDEDVVEEIDEEEVVDSEKVKDSKNSFGSLEKLKVDDSIEMEDEIANAWSKRYGGK